MVFNMHRNWGTKFLFRQILFLSVGVLSIAVLLNRISLITATIQFAATRVPSTRQRLCSWLRPLHLYLLVNGIIIFIAALSRFRTSAEEQPDFMSAATVMQGYEPADIPPDEEIPMRTLPERTDTVEISTISPEECAPALPVDRHSRSTSTRKAVREGDVACNTLDDAWKMIMADRGAPPRRHTLKCDTWHRRCPRISANDAMVMKKWDTTIGDRTENTPTASAACRLRRNPSLTLDELNRRVEAFIRKFNEEMSLQRQESSNQYSIEGMS